jgi:hypothetical protein
MHVCILTLTHLLSAVLQCLHGLALLSDTGKLVSES